MAKHAHLGSSIDNFLAEQGLHDEVTARSLLDRLLDADDTGLTLDTLSRAAAALDLRLHLELRPSTRKRGAR